MREPPMDTVYLLRRISAREGNTPDGEAALRAANSLEDAILRSLAYGCGDAKLDGRQLLGEGKYTLIGTDHLRRLVS